MIANGPRVIIALDLSPQAALALAMQLPPDACRLKVGKELFTAAGPALITELVQRGFDVFLDLKFHDIPNTVAGACRAAAALGIWMLNVHTLGGRAMLEAARDALAHEPARPLLIGVTVLTSLSSIDLRVVGIEGSPSVATLRLAALAQASGLDGVVCSAEEAAAVRSACGEHFCLVTPGIRLPENAHHDQQRVKTPAAAIMAGADYLVIGRPITQAAEPLAVLSAINRDLELGIGN